MQAERLAKDRVRIVRRVLARFLRDFGEGVRPRAVLLLILAPGAAEVLRRAGGLGLEFLQLQHRLGELAHHRLAVREHCPQGPRLHLLEAHRQGDVDDPRLDRLASQVEGRRTGGAVVVHVHDRHAREADFVDHRLAGGGVAVDVAGIGLSDVAVVDPRIGESQTRGLRAHDVPGIALARLGERHHADAGDQRFLTHLRFSSPPCSPPSGRRRS